MRFPELPPIGDLLIDDPAWPYRSGAAAGGGVTHLRVWATKDDTNRRVAVATETGLGSSITNSIEHLWERLRDSAEPVEFVLLEHWPEEESPETGEHIDQVIVDQGQPRWRRIWPTPASNPNHPTFEAWMDANGHEILD